MMSNYDIDSELSKYTNFRGVFAINRIPNRRLYPGECIIFNFEPDSMTGSHWVCAMNDGKVMMYIDPLGMPPPEKIYRYLSINNTTVETNDIEFQPIRSEECGHYCVYFCKRFLMIHDVLRTLYCGPANLYPSHFNDKLVMGKGMSSNFMERSFPKAKLLEYMRGIKGTNAHFEKGPFGLNKLVEDKPSYDKTIISLPFEDKELESERQRIIRDVEERSSTVRNFVGNIEHKAENDILKNGLNTAGNILQKIPGVGPEIGIAGQAINAIGQAIPDYKPVNIEAEREKIKQQFHGGGIQDGDGVISDWFSKWFFKGNKPGEKTVNKLLTSHGDKLISLIVVYREPVVGFNRLVGSVITAGTLDAAVKKYGYDKLFHLFLEIVLEDDYAFKLEKNEVVTVSPITGTSVGESMLVPLKDKKIYLKELIGNAIENQGKDKFYAYSAFTTNCQNFIYNLLNSNGLMNKNLNDFIYQDLSEVVKEVPKWSQRLGEALTDTAAIWRQINGGRIRR